MHVVSTTHIREMLNEALDLAQLAHGTEAGSEVQTDLHNKPTVTIEDVLDQISYLADHASAEARDEQKKCGGWK